MKKKTEELWEWKAAAIFNGVIGKDSHSGISAEEVREHVLSAYGEAQEKQPAKGLLELEHVWVFESHPSQSR